MRNPWNRQEPDPGTYRGLDSESCLPRRSGGTGRRTGLKIPRCSQRVGSTPTSGTIFTTECRPAAVRAWEARLSGDIDLGRDARKTVPFLLVDIRRVGANPTPEFPRDQLTDLRAELGLRRFQESSQAAVFIAYEHRSDALIPRALVINRALFGFRIRGERRPPLSASVPGR